MTPGQERLFWGAVSSLREAETLAQLTNVSGPADEPPRAGDEKSWIEDWAGRAKEALKRAHEMAQNAKKAIRDRARRIAGHVADGARRIYQASPAGKASAALESVSRTANTITLATLVSGAAATVLFLLAAWLLWSRTKGH